MRLHHFFVLTKAPAAEADRLCELGMVEGSANDHPGQGTANRRFFFANTALEFLYVRDANEANSGPARKLDFPERTRNPDASPFGLVMSCDEHSTDPNSPDVAFAGWRYQPDYFDSGVSFLVGNNSDRLDEPLCICMPDLAPPSAPQQRSDPPFELVSQIEVLVPVQEPSEVLEAVARAEGVRVRTGNAHLLDVVFGEAVLGMQRDLRPDLPLRLHW